MTWHYLQKKMMAWMILPPRHLRLPLALVQVLVWCGGQAGVEGRQEFPELSHSSILGFPYGQQQEQTSGNQSGRWHTKRDKSIGLNRHSHVQDMIQKALLRGKSNEQCPLQSHNSAAFMTRTSLEHLKPMQPASMTRSTTPCCEAPTEHSWMLDFRQLLK